MMGAVHLLPGTAFSNANEKASYDSEGRAVLTLAELERWLALQIAGVYHLSEHSARGETPLEAWREGVAKRKQPLRYLRRYTKMSREAAVENPAAFSTVSSSSGENW
jgi:putative transposase